MDGLQESFAGRVNFVFLDWDDKSLNDIRTNLSITDRSQYVLVSADGNILQRWFGYLYEEQMVEEIEAFLQ